MSNEIPAQFRDDEAAALYFDQVQSMLNDLGERPALSQEEQDTVRDFAEQEFSARHCSEFIAKKRRTANIA